VTANDLQASRRGHYEIAQVLLAKGANFSARNKKQFNAVKEAKYNAHLPIYNLIQAFCLK
jgi:ankyrin repeat protein